MAIFPVVLDHPSLGKVTGIQHQDGSVEQYLGIQFATLKDRLAEPVLRTEYAGAIDARRHGPTAPSAPGGFEDETAKFIQYPLPTPTALSESATDCLNLSITVPAAARKAGTGSSSKLPVFIWVHGGGYVVGSHAWPHYDHTRLVKLAEEEGCPVIGVGINYRLGLPGFLTSDELTATGYKGNNFLRDQRAAFRWVRKFIDGFGGDPENVTVVGESAGAMALTLHLFSQQPLFHRAYITGGTALVRPALPAAVHESTYNATIAALGLTDLSTADRINALLTIPMARIFATLPPNIQPNAVIDDELIHTPISFDAVLNGGPDVVPAKGWLKALAIGDCTFDTSVLYFLMGHLKVLAPTFPKFLRGSLGEHPEIAEQILQTYNFTDDSQDANDGGEAAFIKLLEFTRDTSFHLGTLAFAKGFSSSSGNTQVKAFTFAEPNPWPGKFQGMATHVLDVVFLFQNFNEQLDEAQREAARRMGIDFARFVNAGKDEAWKGFVDQDGERGIRVYGPSGRQANVRNESNGEKSATLMRIADTVGWDVLGGCFVDFLMGKYQ